MKVKYLGPADHMMVGNKRVVPGDSVDLSEDQLKILAAPPAGHGIHRFELSDSQQEKLVETPEELNKKTAEKK